MPVSADMERGTGARCGERRDGRGLGVGGDKMKRRKGLRETWTVELPGEVTEVLEITAKRLGWTREEVVANGIRLMSVYAGQKGKQEEWRYAKSQCGHTSSDMIQGGSQDGTSSSCGKNVTHIGKVVRNMKHMRKRTTK